jgi:hypothetical protein
MLIPEKYYVARLIRGKRVSVKTCIIRYSNPYVPAGYDRPVPIPFLHTGTVRVWYCVIRILTQIFYGRKSQIEQTIKFIKIQNRYLSLNPLEGRPSLIEEEPSNFRKDIKLVTVFNT